LNVSLKQSYKDELKASSQQNRETNRSLTNEKPPFKNPMLRQIRPLCKKIIAILVIGIAFLLMPQVSLQANHLVGGELTYECIGGNQYRVNLVIYRDCYSDGAQFDNPAAIFLRDDGGNYLEYDGFYRIPIDFNANDTLRIPVNDEDICSDNIPDVCVSRAVYTTVLDIAPRSGGYEVIYQRCCRNTTIENIFSPGETGSTYSITIPHETANCNNSSPTYTNFPPIVICNDYPILFDHSATDPDGDSLVYELCLPFDGATANNPGDPLVDNFGNYIAPRFDFSVTGNVIDNIPNPIGFVAWQGGYSTNDPLGNAADPLNIDPQTGLLSGTPNGLGQYVVGICVKEYRNGVLLSTNKRDFQFNVTDCNIIRAIPDGDATEIAPGVFEITNCNDAIVNFTNESIGATSYEWDFGVEGITDDVSSEVSPLYLYPDSGTYSVTLVASDGTFCVDTAILIIKHYPIFQTDFIADTDKCQELPFQFTDQTMTTYGVIDSWYWEFGDGTAIGPGAGIVVSDVNTSGTFDAPAHFYEDAGNQMVTLISTNDKGCRDTMQREIEVWKQPEAEIDFDFLCIDAPVNFTGTVAPEDNINSWSWDFNPNTSNGQTTNQTYNAPGNYTANLIVESTQGCKDTAELDFTIFPETFADAGLDASMCFLTSTQLDASNTIGGGGTSNTYLWEPSEYVDDPTQVMPNVSPPADQTFTLYVSDPNGCTDSADVFVNVWELPAIEAGTDKVLCIEDSTQQLNAIIPPNVVDFNWTPPNHLSADDINNPFVYPPDTTEYVLYAIDNNGCEKTDSIQVNVIPMVNPMVSVPTNVICEGDSMQLLASGGMVYTWTPSTGLSNPNIANPIASPTNDTQYTVEIANPPCFVDTASLNITVNPLPFVDAGSDVTINVGETTQFNGMGEESYVWTPPYNLDNDTIFNPTAQPLFTTIYTLTTDSDKSCKASDSLEVTVTNIFEVIMPNAFSPNGDGLHDDIGLRTLGLESLLDFSIYNRWGKRVFHTKDWNERWNGTFKGVPQELGVYVFYVRANKYIGGEFQFQGNITLIR